ncbi:MAG: 50S ribosomal protein L3 [Oscillospiraceae bacterium]|nr:50S ribosomal protein L3 [Oscillospiraceae bacterium]
MLKAIIGKKVGMTHIFDEGGSFVPVTVIEAGPCVVSARKTPELDGYSAVQLGFGVPKMSRVKKPLRGFFEKSQVAPKKFLKEFRAESLEGISVGDVVKSDVFAVGERVDVVGKSKGKGYAGVIKRWNFRRLKETHGSGPVVRHGGSIGMCSDPSRVFKGKKMAGRLGGGRVTVKNLRVVKVDSEKNFIAVCGAVPGANGGIVYLTDSAGRRG